VALAGEQPGRGVEADPARARHVHLRPRVEVGEVFLRPRGTVERYDVGLELDEVARHEPGGQPEAPQDRHEEPARVAAGAEGHGERVTRCLDADFEPRRVGDVGVDRRVHCDKHVVDPQCAVAGEQRSDDRVDPGVDCVWRSGTRVGGDAVQVRLEVALQVRRVGERVAFGVLLDEEVERVDDGHVRDEVDDDLEL
jgi:hypothetical protein